MLITKNNWLRTNLRERLHYQAAPFSVRIEPYPFAPQAFAEACNRTAVELGDRFPKLYLGLSGGSDSAYVLTAFARMKRPITPVIVRIADNYGNRYETGNALALCEQFGIQPIVIDITERDRLLEYLRQVFIPFNGSSPFAVPALIAGRYAHEHGGVLVTGDHIIAGLYEWDFYNEVPGYHFSPFFLYLLETAWATIEEEERHPRENESWVKHRLFGGPWREKSYGKHSTLECLVLHDRIRRSRKTHPRGDCGLTAADFKRLIGKWRTGAAITSLHNS